MKKQDVTTGATYLAKVSGAVVPVQIREEHWVGDKHVGWIGVNTETGRSVKIKSAQRLRRAVGIAQADEAPAPKATKVAPVAPVAGDVGDGGAGSEPVGASAVAASPVPPKGSKGGKGKAKRGAKVRAIAAADQENAKARDERGASKDGMTASERAMARSAKSKGKPAKGAKAPKAAKPAKARPMSGLDAAAKILADAGEPMRVKDIVAVAAKKGLWKSANGKTPEATIYAAIIREIFNKQGESRFVKKDRGLFAAAGK